MRIDIRPIATAGLIGALAFPGHAQRAAPSQDELIQKRTEKLAKPVFEKADWLLDYDAARARAREQQKLLLVYFTRSYAG